MQMQAKNSKESWIEFSLVGSHINFVALFFCSFYLLRSVLLLFLFFCLFSVSLAQRSEKCWTHESRIFASIEFNILRWLNEVGKKIRTCEQWTLRVCLVEFFFFSSKWEWKKCDKQRNKITIDKWIFTQEFFSSLDFRRQKQKLRKIKYGWKLSRFFSIWFSPRFFFLFTFVYITMVVGIKTYDILTPP